MNAGAIRNLERTSIREYVQDHAGLFAAGRRVLDFGAGKPGTCLMPQPYRDLIFGEYVPVDRGDQWPAGDFDAILMTQVIQYLADPRRTLLDLCARLRNGGALVITGPTNWPEVEESDLWRYTRPGIRRLLGDVGLKVLNVVSRAEVDMCGMPMSLGWGATAVKQ